MKAEILKHKVMLFKDNYYLSIWQNGKLTMLLFEGDNIKANNFTIQENRVFDSMYKSFLAKDYEIVA